MSETAPFLRTIGRVVIVADHDFDKIQEAGREKVAQLREAKAEIDRLRAWQQDAIDRIKVYISICDHQRVTGEYMSAESCVYCALDRALIDSAIASTAD